MNPRFSQLGNHADVNSLRPAIHSLCANYGSVARLDILAASQAGRHQALCFLRMDSAEQERHLMQDLGVGRFAGDLVMIVDLQTPGTGRAEAAQLV
jgi:hypothetical protein